MRLPDFRHVFTCSLALAASCIDNPLTNDGDGRSSLTALQVAAGLSRTCALREDREITCWGARGHDGQLKPPAGPFVDFAYNDTTGCGRRADGQLACWGDTSLYYDLPPADMRFKRVAIGSGHLCGIDMQGALRCWGGDLGDAPGLADETDYVDVAAGNGLTCALREGGSVACWTRHDDFQTPSAARFASIVCGSEHACGLQSDGTALCWGSNERGQLNVPNERFSMLAAGHGFTCGILRGQGRVVCWGQRASTANHSLVYVPMESPGGQDFATLAAGTFHVCAIDTAQRVSCWGDNLYGNLDLP